MKRSTQGKLILSALGLGFLFFSVKVVGWEMIAVTGVLILLAIAFLYAIACLCEGDE
jgi:hypothetical protein